MDEASEIRVYFIAALATRSIAPRRRHGGALGDLPCKRARGFSHVDIEGDRPSADRQTNEVILRAFPKERNSGYSRRHAAHSTPTARPAPD
jgi:hypothetical protein